VLPGTYTVTLKYKEHEASGSVNVLPDPRYDLTVAQRREKYDALMHAGQVQETLAEAVKRLRDTRDEIDKVLSMLKEDEGGTEEPEAEAGEPEQDIRKDAAELKKKLTELEERLWMPPGTAKGIARDSSIYSRVSNAYYSMSSSWDPPTEGEQIYLRYAEQRLQAALDEINQVFADDVAEFRGSVESAGIAFLERKEPLALPER
jgi:septal ring factor EnvC (AmiA/AmiB activator)